MSVRAFFVCCLLVAVLAVLCAAERENSPAVVPFVPTPARFVVTMVDMGRNGTTSAAQPNSGGGGVWWDIGSGDGAILIAAVKDGGFASAVGIEHDADLVQRARENAAAAGVADKIEFREGSFFDNEFLEGVERASVVSMYLLPQVVDDVYRKILAHRRRARSHAGTTVLLSLNYPLDTLANSESFHTLDANETTIHKYILTGGRATEEERVASTKAAVTVALGSLPRAPPGGSYRFHAGPVFLKHEDMFLPIVVTAAFHVGDGNPQLAEVWAMVDVADGRDTDDEFMAAVDAAARAVTLRLEFIRVGAMAIRLEDTKVASVDALVQLTLNEPRTVDLPNTLYVTVVAEKKATESDEADGSAASEPEVEMQP